MTQDYLQDFKEACQREGVHYFVVFTRDCGESFHFVHNLNLLPPKVHYPDGCVRTRDEDMQQFISTIAFSDPEDGGEVRQD